MRFATVALLLLVIAASAQAQDPQTTTQNPPVSSMEPVAPTRVELTTQVNQAASLLQKTAEAQVAESAKTQADETITTLKNRIAALEAVTAKTKSASDELEQLKTQQTAAEQQQREAAERARQAKRDLHLTTLSAVANRVDGLQQGLEAARSIGRVAQLTALLKPGKAPPWTNWLDRAGRILGGGAGLVAVASDSGGTRDDATRAALGGVALYLAGNYLRDRLQPQAKEVSELREFIQRVSMHKHFVTDIEGFNRELTTITTALTPVATQTEELLGGDTCTVLRFRVTPKFVQNYRTAVDSYGGMITLLSDLNRIATQMKTDGGWEPAVAGDIERVVSGTTDAIRVWRRGVLTSTTQLQSLEQLSKGDPPATTGCPPSAQQ